MTGPPSHMPNYIRPRIPGTTIFFTVAVADRGSSVLVDQVDALRVAVARTRAERPFHMDAFVVLPDHVHAVWTLPEGDAEYSTRWSVIKARLSRQVGVGKKRQSHAARRERGVWQRRFWEHHVRSDVEYVACVRYCLMNPAKHGFFKRSEDWLCSSIHRDIWEGQWAA